MLAACAFSQPAPVQLEMMQQKYRAFEYDAVIALAEKALSDTTGWTPDQRIHIYEMKAASHYSKMEMQEAFTSFMSILRINPDHELDPMKTSPKIVTFYNEIKHSFQQAESRAQTAEPESREQLVDTVRVVEQSSAFYRKTLPLSLILPGTGHWVAGNIRKGPILTSVSTLLLGASVYYTFDTARHETTYLEAITAGDIERAYSDYNSSYRTRNALWGAYALVWLYTQTDLLFFQTPTPPIEITLLPPTYLLPGRILCSFHF